MIWVPNQASKLVSSILSLPYSAPCSLWSIYGILLPQGLLLAIPPPEMCELVHKEG